MSEQQEIPPKKTNYILWLFIGGLVVMIFCLAAAIVLVVNIQPGNFTFFPATDTPSATAQLTSVASETTQPAASPTVARTFTPSFPTLTPFKLFTPTFGIPEDGFYVWCLPRLGYVPTEWEGELVEMPEDAEVGAYSKGVTDLKFPFISCTFVYTFNQPAPKDAEIRIYYADQPGSAPWLTKTLVVSTIDPQMAQVTVKHAYITDPPVWEILYKVIAVSASGKELKSDLVRFHKWKPSPCWDGSLPHPVTLECPSEDRDW